MGIFVLSIHQRFSFPASKASPVPLGRLFFVSAPLVRDVLLRKMTPPSCFSEDVNLPKQMMGRGTPDNSGLILRNLYSALPQCLPDKEVVCQKKRIVTTPDDLIPSPRFRQGAF